MTVQMRRQIFRDSKQKIQAIAAPIALFFVTNVGKYASSCAVKALAGNCAVALSQISRRRFDMKTIAPADAAHTAQAIMAPEPVPGLVSTLLKSASFPT